MPIAVKGGEVGARYVGGTRSKMHLDLHRCRSTLKRFITRRRTINKHATKNPPRDMGQRCARWGHTTAMRIREMEMRHTTAE